MNFVRGKIETEGLPKGPLSPLSIGRFQDAKIEMRKEQLYPHELVDSFVSSSKYAFKDGKNRTMVSPISS